MNVREALKILTECDQDRTLYVRDKDGTAQPVAAIVDLRHMNIPRDMGISIPDDIALMAAGDYEESAEDDEGEEPVETL